MTTANSLDDDIWAVTGGLKPGTVRPAARIVALASLDAEDCRELLDMLGLLEAIRS